MKDKVNQFPDEIEELDEKGSNSSVMDLSIDKKDKKEIIEIKEEKEEYSPNFLSKSFDEKINFFKRFILKENVENLLDLSEEEDNRSQRKYTDFNFFAKNYEKKAPKRKTLINNEYMSPFTLNCNKKNNDYRINDFDSKSTDDKNELYEYNGNNDDENIQKIKNLEKGFFKFLRKKMIEFRNSYIFKKRNEYENILNIENVFSKSDIMILKPNSRKNFKKKKKCHYWHKHILEQNRRSSLNVNLNRDNIYSQKKHKRAGTINISRSNEGLFILGVLECAALDKKRRKSAFNVKI